MVRGEGAVGGAAGKEGEKFFTRLGKQSIIRGTDDGTIAKSRTMR